MDLTREAITKIEELTTKANGAEIVEIEGRKFSTKSLTEIKPVKNNIGYNRSFDDLTSLVDYLTAIHTHTTLKDVKLLVKCKCDKVEVFTEPDFEGDSVSIACATPLLPNITFDRYLGLEEFLIQLLTKFVQNENTVNLTQLLSRFQSNHTVETTDDGISQKIVVSQGQGLNEKVNLSPIVRLQAFRTFREISQEEVLYLLRVNKTGDIALFEADGGAWKFESQNKVRDYMRDAIQKVGLSEKVVVL